LGSKKATSTGTGTTTGTSGGSGSNGEKANRNSSLEFKKFLEIEMNSQTNYSSLKEKLLNKDKKIMVSQPKQVVS
jgi:hypothetical protein